MPQTEPPLALAALDHLVLTVSNIPATIHFYTEILRMKARQFTTLDGTHCWALHFGQVKFNLHEKGAEFDPKVRLPTPGAADLCLLTRTPLPRWQDHLAGNRIDVELGPIPRTGANGPITSLYIRDPDGNLIEISAPGSP